MTFSDEELAYLIEAGDDVAVRACRDEVPFVDGRVLVRDEDDRASECVREREVQFEDVTDHCDLVPGDSMLRSDLLEHMVVVWPLEQNRTSETLELERVFDAWDRVVVYHVLLGVAVHSFHEPVEGTASVTGEFTDLLLHLGRRRVRDNVGVLLGAHDVEGRTSVGLEARLGLRVVVAVQDSGEEPIHELRGELQTRVCQDHPSHGGHAEVWINRCGSNDPPVVDPSVAIRICQHLRFELSRECTHAVHRQTRERGEIEDEPFAVGFSLDFGVSGRSIEVEDDDFDFCASTFHE